MCRFVRWRVRCVALIVVTFAIGGAVRVQTQSRVKGERSAIPRTAEGRPDLHGTWTNATLTPLERPRNLGERRFFTEAEVAVLEADAERRRLSADDKLVAGDIGSYNQFWFDSGSKILPTRQTSLVVDPSDGRVPLRKDAEAHRDEYLKHSTEHPEFMSVWDQCISRGVPGWIIPAGYNNAYQIVQTPGYVVIHAEMIHDARVVPLGGQPPPPASVRLLEGDSRGRWDGDTLVVETTNFSDRNWIATSAASGRIKGIPQSTALRIVERFTMVAPNRIDYEARIEDPAVFTRPWTLAFPLMKDDEYRIYEYACHEGNRAVEGILRGERYQERTGRSQAATAAAVAQDKVRVGIQTELGDIVVEVDQSRAPITAANFLRYVDAGHYDGGTWHRTVKMDNQPESTVKIEVIQAGVNPERAKQGFGPIELERTNVTGISHQDGVISMARGAPDSATSGWFICINDQPSLDFGGHRNPDGQGFAAFGRVVSGMDVVRKIQTAASSTNRTTNTEAQRLAPPIKILKVARQ